MPDSDRLSGGPYTDGYSCETLNLWGRKAGQANPNPRYNLYSAVSNHLQSAEPVVYDGQLVKPVLEIR